MIGIDWIAEEPVPMTPTRSPVKSRPDAATHRCDRPVRRNPRDP
jgi:hypothetical protein